VETLFSESLVLRCFDVRFVEFLKGPQEKAAHIDVFDFMQKSTPWKYFCSCRIYFSKIVL